MQTTVLGPVAMDAISCYEAYVSKYRLLYMVVSEPIKSFVVYLRKGNTGWELIHIPFCTLL